MPERPDPTSLPGGCPRIRVLVKIEKFLENRHSHILNIASIIFLKIRRFWEKVITGQPPGPYFNTHHLVNINTYTWRKYYA